MPYCLQKVWIWIRLIMPMYLYLQQISLRDMQTLYLRGSDRRQKRYQEWLLNGGVDGGKEAVHYVISN